MTSWWCPSVCLSFRTPFIPPFPFGFLPSDFQNSFFVWKVSHERPYFYTFCPSVRAFIRLFVHPSVTYIFHFPFLPSDFQNYFFVWKVWHERPNFFTFCPSVCPSVYTSVCPSVRYVHLPLSVITVRIFKILFLFEMYYMRDQTVIIFVRLSVRLSFHPSVRTPSSFRYYSPIFKILFLLERYDIRYLTLIIFVRRPSVYLSVPYFPFNFCSNN